MQLSWQEPEIVLADYFTGEYVSESRELEDGRYHSDWLLLWNGNYIPITDWSEVRVVYRARMKRIQSDRRY